MSAYLDMAKKCDEVLAKDNPSNREMFDLCWLFYEAFGGEYQKDGLRYFTPELASVSKRNILVIKTWLIGKQERSDHELAVAQAQASRTSVSASAESNVSVSASFYQAMSGIDSCDGLTDGQKDEVQKLLLEAKRDAEKDPSKFAETAKKAISAAEKSASAISAVVQALGLLAKLIGQ